MSKHNLRFSQCLGFHPVLKDKDKTRASSDFHSGPVRFPLPCFLCFLSFFPSFPPEMFDKHCYIQTDEASPERKWGAHDTRENVCAHSVLPACVSEAKVAQRKCVHHGLSCSGSVRQLSGTDYPQDRVCHC